MTDRLDLRRRLQNLAFRQAGYFTAAQALEAGYSYQAQKYHADRGNWLRIDRGLFRLPEWPANADDAYARWSAWSQGSAVVSHESAAAVHDISDLDPGHVHLTVPRAVPGRPGVVLHAAVLDDRDVQDQASFRVTTPERTVLDLAGSVGVTQEHLDAAVLDALESGRLDESVLRRRMDSFGTATALRLERALHVAVRP